MKKIEKASQRVNALSVASKLHLEVEEDVEFPMCRRGVSKLMGIEVPHIRGKTNHHLVQ
jgi:iron-sulfur cluster repair protein YtfE (RIC family)